jgi:hypothetical protein
MPQGELEALLNCDISLFGHQYRQENLIVTEMLLPIHLELLSAPFIWTRIHALVPHL